MNNRTESTKTSGTTTKIQDLTHGDIYVDYYNQKEYYKVISPYMQGFSGGLGSLVVSSYDVRSGVETEKEMILTGVFPDKEVVFVGNPTKTAQNVLGMET